MTTAAPGAPAHAADAAPAVPIPPAPNLSDFKLDAAQRQQLDKAIYFALGPLWDMGYSRAAAWAWTQSPKLVRRVRSWRR